MKRIIGWICLALLMTASSAMAAPVLEDVSASDGQLIIGQDGWSVSFSATEGGTLAMQLLSGETGEVVADLGAVQMEAGEGRIGWNGLLPDGTPAARQLSARRADEEFLGRGERRERAVPEPL